MFGELIIPAVVGGVVGSTRFGKNIWPTITPMKAAAVGAGLGLGYAMLRSNSGISGNIDMQRKFFSRGQGYRQALYTRSISAGGVFDGIRLT
ncbi:hypothetical protein LCGC14_1427030 [marine sediment metagenome]|uniref:Uncharacterized protein n=1 Tax=marine sediment metagenome TaxID=412755 RepID=A0A0F9JQ59_9ZZZZ